MVSKTVILLDGLVFGEGSRWRDGKLWFFDIHAHKMMTVDFNGNTGLLLRFQRAKNRLL